MNNDTERQSRDRMNMMLYKSTLKKLTDNSFGSQPQRQDTRKLEFKLKEGEIYAVRALDNSNYYYTVFLKRNFYTNGITIVQSQYPVYGEIPDNLREVEPEQLYKYMRVNNLTHMNKMSFKAFPTETRQEYK